MSPSAVKTSHDQSTQDAVRAMSSGAGSAERLATPVLQVADLAVSFDNSSGGPRIQAVNGVNMTLFPQQTLAVVGESGCGKSVTAMSTMQLIARPPGRFDRGSILFEGRDIVSLSEEEMLSIRGGKIAMIFQEPMTSLNPVYSIGDQLMEAIFLHQKVGPDEAKRIAVQAMKDVGIKKPEERLAMYPHQRTRDMGIMLITHNLGVVAENADVVCVMYAGRVVEYANVFELFDEPLHPYTRGLFRSIPMLRDTRERLVTIKDVTHDPAEFRKIPGVIPWWPDMPAGVRPDGAPGRDEHVLVEVRPNRWVGCWRTPELEARSHRRPSLDYRRGDR